MEGEPAAARADARPVSTLYVRNLDDHIHKEKLRRSLYECFSAYGRVLDVVALKTMRMRGQAFIAFDDVPAAANALRHTNGLAFYGRPMTVQFARDRCQRVRRREGYSKASAKERKAVAKLAHKARQDGEDAQRIEDGTQMNGVDKEARDAQSAPAVPVADDSAPRNRILFAQNVADNVDSESLSELFREFEGFVEVRLIAGRQGLAFVEFDDDEHAEIALKGMQSFKLAPNQPLVLSFAKR